MRLVTIKPLGLHKPISQDKDFVYNYFKDYSTDFLSKRLITASHFTQFIEPLIERSMYNAEYFGIMKILNERKDK